MSRNSIVVCACVMTAGLSAPALADEPIRLAAIDEQSASRGAGVAGDRAIQPVVLDLGSHDSFGRLSGQSFVMATEHGSWARISPPVLDSLVAPVDSGGAVKFQPTVVPGARAVSLANPFFTLKTPAEHVLVAALSGGKTAGFAEVQDDANHVAEWMLASVNEREMQLYTAPIFAVEKTASPNPYAMLLAGLGLLGFMARQRVRDG